MLARPHRSALVFALTLLVFLTAGCGSEDDNTPAPQVVDMGALTLNAPTAVSATVSGLDVHVFTFTSAPGAQHRVIVMPADGNQDPDVGVFAPAGNHVGNSPSIACQGNTDLVTFTAGGSTTYTVQVVNGGGCPGGLTSAAYSVQVLSP